ncbi:hypothetical protein GGX14DRAFT_388026 [Mycena pura]|uniref:Uncharacterized protein n=1 Tax=Mycena pura TaxID=153505 RepID=A0AAD6YKD0_9AGAR|nr:hypothetical protein GGX14DRAFT_388026 [Mycena pura]
MASPEVTYSQRAREWQTTPFIAEWLENTFNECTSPEGKVKFEKWAVRKWGLQKGQEMVKECNKRNPRGKWVPDNSKNLSSLEKRTLMWKSSAAFYGEDGHAMQNWHHYAAQSKLLEPERKKPPPKRRAGESSGQWMSISQRVNDGHKPPNVDLEIARRIAISEYDKTRDTLERWRTDRQLFFADILSRSKSIIPSPQVLSMDEQSRQRIAMDDAFRTRVIFLSMVHLAWKDAAELFEHLAQKGLNTASAVERAYQKDNTLVWRLMSVINRNGWMARKMWANFSQLIVSSEYFQPLFKTWRDNSGFAHIDANVEAIQKRIRQRTFTTLDDAIVNQMVEKAPPVKAFFQAVESGLSDNPVEANKFSAEVFDAMGDLAAAYDFIDQFDTTPFGNRLIQYASALEAQTVDHKQMRSIIYFMDPDKLPKAAEEYWDRAGEVSRSIREMEGVWSREAWKMSVEPLLLFIQLQQGPRGFDGSVVIPLPLFNDMWGRVDDYLWNTAKKFDRKGEEGRVAKEFGLFNPADPKRPMASEFLLRSLDPELGLPMRPKTTPAPYVQNIPVAGPGDSIVQSGYTYVTGLFSGTAPKEKVKTRGEASAEEAPEDEEAEERRVLPEVLPSEFKIGKKVLKLFHRILEPPEDEKEDAPKKGQVRWGDFENAMKRIGFEIMQTAGSSVRFDPPASTARPITFHRHLTLPPKPHPDSLLTPHAIKWVGARLKRTYGWTTATFQRSAGEETT